MRFPFPRQVRFNAPGGPCGAHVGLLGVSWATFPLFWAHLCLKLFFEAILFDFLSILGGLGEDLGSIFRRFFAFLVKIAFF